MKDKWLECNHCHTMYEITESVFVCPKCSEQGEYYGLEANYHYEHAAAAFQRLLKSPIRSMWDFSALLPIADATAPVSLGEGNTAMSRIHAFRSAGLENVWYKNESLNPTWSHKDRFNSVAVTKAKELGFSKVTTSSTGNHGASTAAYAARAEMKSIIFFPPEAPKLMVDLASHYGATAVITEWDARSDMVKWLIDHGWYATTSLQDSPASNPFGVEGYKTIAYEIVAQMGHSPDKLLIPVASGGTIYGLYKGFKELLAMGLIHRCPEIIGCQASGANVLERSFQQGSKQSLEQVDAYSLATSTRERVVGDRALKALYESGGRVVAVTDFEIQEAMRLLGKEGYCVEAASAIPVACVRKMLDKGGIAAQDTVVCVLTASGVKSPDILADLREPAVRMDANIEALQMVLSRW